MPKDESKAANVSEPRRHRKKTQPAPPPAGTQKMRFSLVDLQEEPPEDVPMRAYVDVFNAKGSHSHRQAIHIAPTSPVKDARRELMSFTPIPGPVFAASPSVDEDDGYTMTLLGEETNEPEPQATPKNADPSPADRALAEWREHRDRYLSLLLWHDGRGTLPEGIGCSRCGNEQRQAVARCVDCATGDLMCEDCCVDFHVEHPLHWIEIWNGTFFQRRSLHSLGLRLQLGHRPRQPCPNPTPAHSKFVVLHINGIHLVAVDFCGCNLQRDSHHVQLLRRRWFPSTTDQPRTCATFACLDTFQTLSLKAKTTPYDYYGVLECLTDGSGLKPVSRYRVFLRMAREYRHLQMLKRAGRGHAADGVAGTGIGELAVRCPACPRPDINLPSDWRTRDEANAGLYILYIAIDACFRLKRRAISSVLRDPALVPGWAYFVEPEPYRQYLLTVTDQKEISTCNGLRALDYANTKFSRGYSATGVGMGVCARHEFVLPTSVGDLQKGERYGNMDYIFASALRYISRLLRVIASALPDFPRLVRLKIVMTLFRFVVPKMHIKGHVLLCQLLFSLSFAAGSGQTDGEGIERMWAIDQLEDHWGFWNWSKLIGLAALLRRRLDNARRELKIQEEALETFTLKQIENVPAWKDLIAKFEAPREEGQPEPQNPYEPTCEGLNEAELRKQYAAEDAEAARNGNLPISVLSPSQFVGLGLEIEDEQRRIRVLAEVKKVNLDPTDELGTARRKCNELIKKFRSVQATFTPAALVRLQSADGDSTTDDDNADQRQDIAEDVALLLPSALTKAERKSGCLAEVVDIEIAMRRAQCRALVLLRVQLHAKSRLLTYKHVHSRHQASNTRARALINRNEGKVKLHAEKYQSAWRALVALVGLEHVGFKRLLKDEIRCMEDPGAVPSNKARERAKEKRRAEADARRVWPSATFRWCRRTRPIGWSRWDDDDDDIAGTASGKGKGKGSGESRRVMSWIWEDTATAGSEAELDDAVRIEWSKGSGARLPISLLHIAHSWERRREEVKSWGDDREVLEGKVAYAEKQRALFLDLIARAEVTRTRPESKRAQKARLEGSCWRAEAMKSRTRNARTQVVTWSATRKKTATEMRT
ncbi:CxC2 domain-containing protein [Mycena chlorophos]|uniref:CxC2 domain-containing protein n=1 Tax=Mycena chlorophos TaxID=658473 RepID=A0A8H6WG33_MYCCL|nr:CxC2 domain-containing protein [Mycena chlorophos]